MPHSNLKLVSSGQEAEDSSPAPLRQNVHPQRLAFLLPNLGGGGVQRNTLVTASALHSCGYQVDLVLCSGKGPLRQQVPDTMNTTVLTPARRWASRWFSLRGNLSMAPALALPVLAAGKPSKTLAFLPSLADYLRRNRPDVLFAATTHQNIEAVLARNAAGAGAVTRVAVTQSTTLSSWHQVSGEWRRRHLLPLLRRCYRNADAVIAVSNAVADDLAAYAHLDRDTVSTIYTPLIPDDISERAAEPLDHPWFQNSRIPVLLAVGRPGRAKDYPTLLRAFAHVRKRRKARLVILGEARDPYKNQERLRKLHSLVSELGVSEDVSMPGYTQNPYRYMARASLLVLSSRYEGFPSVVPEALACGCPIVSTRCPGGVCEALEDGRYGRLVTVGDDRALANAICATLDETPEHNRLRTRGAFFSIRRCRDHYEELILSLTRED